MGFVGDAIGSVVGGITGADKQADAAGRAGDLSYRASQDAIKQQREMFDKLQANQQPYMDLGENSIAGLMSLLRGQGLNNQFNFDPSQLENTPGYQFTLQQGLKGLANANSAKGLGMSGAQMKGMQDYTTGLANQTYGDQYNRALQQFQTNYGVNSDMYNRFSGLVGLGQNAAAGVGNAGMQTASGIGQLGMQGASALGSAGIGQANIGSSMLPNAMNLGSSAAGIYSLFTASDVRVKHDIKHIGVTPGGHNWYRFKYVDQPGYHEGVMAQEVEKTIPDAVVEIDGIKHVDYSKVN